jgi:hypothetical protein
MTTRKLLTRTACAVALIALGLAVLFPAFAQAKMGRHRHGHSRTVLSNGFTDYSPPTPKPVASAWSPIRSINLKGFVPKTGTPVIEISGQTTVQVRSFSDKIRPAQNSLYLALLTLGKNSPPPAPSNRSLPSSTEIDHR